MERNKLTAILLLMPYYYLDKGDEDAFMDRAEYIHLAALSVDYYKDNDKFLNNSSEEEVISELPNIILGNMSKCIVNRSSKYEVNSRIDSVLDKREYIIKEFTEAASWGYNKFNVLYNDYKDGKLCLYDDDILVTEAVKIFKKMKL